MRCLPGFSHRRSVKASTVKLAESSSGAPGREGSSLWKTGTADVQCSVFSRPMSGTWAPRWSYGPPLSRNEQEDRE